MDKIISVIFNRIVPVILCVTMVFVSFAYPAYAEESTDDVIADEDMSVEVYETSEALVDDGQDQLLFDGVDRSRNVFVDITGTYYTLYADTILGQINKIRKEAYDEGLTDKYVPAKWSYVIEQSARKRAMEAGITLAHANLYGGNIYEYMRFSDLFWGCAENLAWNNNHNSSGITYGINQFYEEKADYLKELKGKPHGVTGHYTNMIDPDHEYVGVAGCQMSGTQNGWFTVAMQFGAYPNGDVDESKDDREGSITNTLEAAPDHMGNLTFSAEKKDDVTYLDINGKLIYGSSSATFKIPHGEERGVVWTSSDESVATVSNGVVSALKGGKTTITATIGDKTISKDIVVSTPLKSLTLTCDEIATGVLNDGTFEVERDTCKTGTVIVGYLPEDATDAKKVTWSSSNTGVATIDSAGRFILKKAGTAVITAKASTSDPDNKTISASFTVNVKVPVTGVSLNKETATLNYTSSKAPTVQLIASVIPADAQSEDSITYTSSDTNVATVTTNGLVTAISGGQAVVTASYGSFSDDCEIIVNAPVRGISVNPDPVRLYTSEDGCTVTATLTPRFTSEKEVTFSSDDNTVYAISEEPGTESESVTVGSVNGEATVNLVRKTDQNKSAKLSISSENPKYVKTVDVVIAKPTESLSVCLVDDSTDLSGKNIEAEPGTALNCIGSIKPDDAYDHSVVWSSSDETVAIVRSTGNNTATVSCIGCGNAVISCTSNNAPTPVTNSFTISSSIKPSKVTLNRSKLTLYEGNTYTLTASVEPEGVEGSVSFSSADSSVAQVDAYGLITAKSAGETVITASCEGAMPAKCKVVVRASDPGSDDDQISGNFKDGVWIAKDGFKESAQYTGKAITQQDIKVYCDNRLLTEKTDYTLSYGNNVKAATADSEKAPYVTVNLKGQYQGKKTYRFTITPVDIGDSGIITETKPLVVIGNGKAVKPVPELFFGNVKLNNKTDFECEYPDDEYTSTGVEHTIKVTGKGNYSGTRTCKFIISDAKHSLAKASVIVTSADGNSRIYFKDGISASDLTITVRLDGNTLPSSYYSVTSIPAKVGKGSIRIDATEAGNENSYYGYKIVNITSYADRLMKDAVIDGFADTVSYSESTAKSSGGIRQNAVLKYGEETLTEGKDYAVSYTKNTNAGNASVTYTGTGRYSGKITRKFRITPCTTNLTVNYESEMTFVKGGVTPDVRITDSNGISLNSKTDYTVKIVGRSNTKPGTMIFYVEGKGNYKGYRSGNCEVNVKYGNLKEAALVLTDKKYVAKGSGWKSSVKVVDANGKVLRVGIDYDKNVLYRYDGMTPGSVPGAGTIVYVTVVGINDYAGSSITRSYRIYQTDIGKLVFTVDQCTYDGQEQEPRIRVYPSSRDAKARTNEITDMVYKVMGYSSNINVGTGKVTIRGIGDYGGTNVLSFKINKQSFFDGQPIVWLGDSLTQGALGHKNDNLKNAPYEKLKKIISENSLNVPVQGMGLWGYNTREIFTTYKRNNQIDPNKTYIFWVGSNDWVNDDGPNTNTGPVIEQINEFLSENGGVNQYIVIGTTARWKLKNENRYITINTALKEEYDDNYMDVISIIEREGNGYSSDNTHLTQASYDAIAEAVYDKLVELNYL